MGGARRRVRLVPAAKEGEAVLKRGPRGGPTTIEHDTIIKALRTTLEPLPFVHAFVEGGAAAWGRFDAWSDIDLSVFIEEAKFDETFRAVEATLLTLSPIEQTFVEHGPSEEVGSQQKFYRLAKAGPFLLVDLSVMTNAATEKYLQPEIHGDNVVYFDKTGVTKVPPLNRSEFDRRIRDRLRRLRGMTEMFHPFVQKELNRGNSIEAITYYRGYILAPLLEVLRMRYGPLHYSFRTRYVHYELPADVVNRLQALFYVRDAEDLRQKSPEAFAWFREVAAELPA